MPKTSPIKILLLLPLLLVGCGVSQTLYRVRLNELERCESDALAYRNSANARLEEQNREHDELIKRNETMAASAERLAAERKRLAENLKSTQHELEDLRRAHEAANDRTRNYQEFEEKLHDLLQAGKLKLELRHTRLVLSIPASLLFEEGKTKLSNAGQEILHQITATLREFPDRNFQVSGHTDNSPPQRYGGLNSNWELSVAYALAVVKFMQATGIDPRHLRVAGYSEFSPVASNTSATGRQANRRVELSILPSVDEVFRIEDTAAAETASPAAAPSAPSDQLTAPPSVPSAPSAQPTAPPSAPAPSK